MSFEELLKENIFHNDLITKGNRTIDSKYSDWQHRGILKVYDVLKHDREVLSGLVVSKFGI